MCFVPPHQRSHPVYATPWGRRLLVLLCGTALGMGLVALAGRPAPLWGYALALAALLGVIAAGVFWLAAGVFCRPLLRGPGDRPLVALTFDDGPDPEGTPRVLEALARHGAQATFFVIGARAARHPELLRELARRGHQVENHSYHHGYDTPLRDARALAAELAVAQRLITDATGRAPRWFRPPVGLLSPRVAEAARRAGLALCGYSCKARDGLARTTVDEALLRLRGGLRPGAILVLHDAVERGGRAPIAADVLERLLPLLQERGLRAVTLDALLRSGEGA